MNNSFLVQAAVAGLMFSAAQGFANEKAKTTSKGEDAGYCHGVNECKGKGLCGGKVFHEANDCAGHNKCKGHGAVKMSKKECLAKKGKYAEKLM